MENSEILSIAQKAFQGEVRSLVETGEKLGDGFIKAVRMIADCSGKIVTTGIGKSGLVARKIAATFASTGTPSIFVHPVECLHGDMGIIGSSDIALILSKSGESDEIGKLIVFLRNRQITIISITANNSSYLARKSDAVIPIFVGDEGCPMPDVPMASTTCQMVIGDSLASVMIKLRGFRQDDFALFHPAGSIGKRLLLKVGDLMHSGNEIPLVRSGTSMRDALVVMTSKSMGAILVGDQLSILKGILTDGDLRRAIQTHGDLLNMTIDEIMTPEPISVSSEEKAIEALNIMEKRASQISVLPVIDEAGKICGIIRLHDLVLAGI